VEGVRVADYLDLWARKQDLRVDWPFLMNVALTRDLVALEVEKEEVIRGIGFTEGYARALDPWPCA
jgi:hypothetical protein